jgi:superkiller protein 3
MPLGNPARAKDGYQRAVDLQPDFAIAYCNLAIVLLDLGETEAAWASGLRAVELDWRIGEAHMTVGCRALLQLDHPEPAAAALKEAVKANPKLGRAHHGLGLAVQRLGRFEEAVGHHRRAVALELGLPESWSGLGLALCAFGQFDERRTSNHRRRCRPRRRQAPAERVLARADRDPVPSSKDHLLSSRRP